MTAPSPRPPATGRRTSPRIVFVHTATFRQARQFVPAVIPIVEDRGTEGRYKRLQTCCICETGHSS